MILENVLAKSIDIVLGRDVTFDLALHGGIPVVLNGIVRATGKKLGNLGPLVAESLVMGNNETIFLLAPRLLANGRIEMVVPTLTALLADAACVREGVGAIKELVRSV